MKNLSRYATPGGGAGSPGVSTNFAQALFVDPNGSDSTGTKGVAEKPFLTLTAARDAAVDGDTIFVNPGTYLNQRDLLRQGVNWHFAEGAVLSETSSDSRKFIFDDHGSGCDCAIGGFGDFVLDTSVFIHTLIHLTADDSILSMQSRHIDGGCDIYQHAGNLFITCDRMYGNLYNWNGTQNVEVKEFYGPAYQKGSGQQRLYLNYMAAGNGMICESGNQYVHSEATYSTAICSGGIQSINAPDVNLTSTTPAVVCYAGTQRINAGNVYSSIDGSQIGIRVVGGACTVNTTKVTQYQPVAGVTRDTIYVSGGSLRIINAQIISKGYGLPIRKEGGLLELQNCILVSASGTGIGSTTAQNILLCGNSMSNVSPSGNITLQGGVLTVDSNVVAF